MKLAPKIKSVEVQEPSYLLVDFQNGCKKKYNVSGLLNRPMFAPLKNPAFLKTVKVEPGGYALVWNDKIDISEYELWQNGVDVTT